MNWKKILKYLLLIVVLGTILLVVLANRGLDKIYGGHTKVADFQSFDYPGEDVAIQNVHLLSPDGKAFIPGQTVYVKEGMIISIDSTTVLPQNIQLIDGSGKYLIPGLIDAHIHLFKSENDLLLYVANGVTQIRELIGSDLHLSWRKQIRKGRIGPNMYVTSPRIGSFGSVEGFFMEWTQWFKNIRNNEEAEQYVLELKEKGYDGVKVYSHLNKESYRAINKTAEELNMDVLGHIPWSCELEDIWSSNQSDIAHLEEIMNAFRREFGNISGQDGSDAFLEYVDQRSQEIVDDLLSNDISVTTTLWLVESFVRQKFELEEVLREVALEYVNPGISEWVEYVPGGLGWLPTVNRYQLPEDLSSDEIEQRQIFWTAYAQACQVILKNLSEGGVKIMAGTDANLPPTVPGFSLHDELISLHRAGMSKEDVLRSATAVPANWLGTNTGQLKEGYRADMVLLDDNPLEDIRNTKAINTVFLNGRILDRSRLDDMLEAVKTANDESRNIDIRTYVQ